MRKSMIEVPSHLQDIPASSVRAYHENLTFLVDRVNKKMADHRNVQDLIGPNRTDIMFENHRNHAIFMDNLMRLDILDLLSEFVPWVYRAYTNHGFSFDYFPAHLQAWKEALHENLEPGISDPILQVYDWMLSRHEEFIQLSKESPLLNTPSLPQEKELQDRFLRALLRGDRSDTLNISREQVMKPQDLGVFYRNVLQPAMYRIGELWEQGDITVSKEHLASALVNAVISSQYVQVMSDLEPWKDQVLVTAAPNEFHVLGAQMVANCLESEGWDVDYLGANTPASDLLGYIRDRRPKIVALSIAMPFNLINAKDIIDMIHDEFQESRPKIMVGGLAFVNRPELVSRIGGDGYAEDCRRAIEIAEKWYKDKEKCG